VDWSTGLHTEAPKNQGKAMVSLIQPRRPQPRLASQQRMTRSKYRCAIQVLLTHFRRICAVTSCVQSSIPDSRGCTSGDTTSAHANAQDQNPVYRILENLLSLTGPAYHISSTKPRCDHSVSDSRFSGNSSHRLAPCLQILPIYNNCSLHSHSVLSGNPRVPGQLSRGH
jgi:hypothetical protein